MSNEQQLLDIYREFCGVWRRKDNLAKVRPQDLHRFFSANLMVGLDELRKVVAEGWGERIEPMPEQELEKFMPVPKKERYHNKYPLLSGDSNKGLSRRVNAFDAFAKKHRLYHNTWVLDVDGFIRYRGEDENKS